MNDRKIIACDFDNCINLNAKFPDIGEPNTDLIKYLVDRQKEGHTVILWTCRCGETLDRAVEFCIRNGFAPDYINENAPWIIEAFGGDTRKIFANKYIDDASVTPWEIMEYMPKPAIEMPKPERRKARIVR